MWALLLSLASAGPLDPEGEQRLRTQLQAAVEEAEALGRAAGFVHNAVPRPVPAGCDPQIAQLVARAGAFTTAWGLAVTDVAALAKALGDVAAAPTLQPLRSASHTRADGALRARAERTAAAHRGAEASLRTQLSGVQRRCPTEVLPGDGWPRPGAVARDDPPELRAVWLTQAGWLCGGVSPEALAPGPVLLEQTTVCLSQDSACDCTPANVLAGAAL